MLWLPNLPKLTHFRSKSFFLSSCWTFGLHCSQRLISYLNNLLYFCEHFQTHQFLFKHCLFLSDPRLFQKNWQISCLRFIWIGESSISAQIKSSWDRGTMFIMVLLLLLHVSQPKHFLVGFLPTSFYNDLRENCQNFQIISK